MASRESEFKTLIEVGTVGRGKSKHRPRNDPDLYGGDYPFVQTGDVKHAPFYLSEYTQTYNERGLAQSKIWPVGTLCITIAANIADTAILDIPACFPDSILGFTPKAGCADVRYVKYCLDGFRAYMELISRGTTQDNLSLDKLLKLRFWFPHIDIQRKIAAILSAYDDLIANNQRRIALLEGMAEEIYREWFVRMRFPGGANVEVEKGVPSGWSLVPTIEAFRYHGGATPAKDVPRYWNEGTVHWYTPTDITAADGMFIEASAEKCTEEGLESCSATLFPAYTVMMTSRATIGAIGINLEPACTNQGFIACVPNERYPLTFLYHWLTLAKPHFELLSGGSTFPELTKGTFKRIKVLTPPSSLMQTFDTTVKPLFAQIEMLIRANRRLKETRAALLPRLISGKLKVDHLDIRLPQSMRAEAETVA